MRNEFFIPLVLALLGCASSSSNVASDSPGSSSREEELVRSLDDQERRAALSKDVNTLERLSTGRAKGVRRKVSSRGT